jgi:putative ABC transport system ATP-binding protein
MALIELKNIHRVFRVGDQDVHALNDVSLTVDKGEHLAIMGPSGSGKSTLLNLIGLLDQPTAGSYCLDGRNVTALSDDDQAWVRRSEIGFVFQFFHLLPRLTAAENVELPLILGAVAPAQRRQRVQEALASMGLADRAGHRPDQLSGGQRQRVAIARATVTQPSVILADEPTGNLDRHSGRDVVELLERLNARGITLIVVTHDPEIGGRAHRRIHIVDGRITDDSRDRATGNAPA